MDTVSYYHLPYEAYKSLERQMKKFSETTHVATPGPFYHKSIRLRITPTFIIEFHGPNVRGKGEAVPADEREVARKRELGEDLINYVTSIFTEIAGASETERQPDGESLRLMEVKAMARQALQEIKHRDSDASTRNRHD